MAELGDVILFISTTSRYSMIVLEFLTRIQLRVKVVRLDSKEMRNSVTNNKLFKITSVPTLMLVYSDGKVQLYIGIRKVITILKKIVPQKDEIEMIDEDDEDDEDAPVLFSEDEQADFTEPSKTKGLMVGETENIKENRMESIKEEAKKMERMRNNALGNNK